MSSKKEVKHNKRKSLGQKIKDLKLDKIRLDKTEIIAIILLILDLITYFSLNKIVNIIILFLTYMSISLLLVYVVGILVEKKTKYIDNILGITLILHILIIGIILGRICYCGHHYFYVIPLILYGIVELVLHNIFVLNYKEKKNMKYFFKYFLFVNALFIVVVLLSRVNMEKLHIKLYKL